MEKWKTVRTKINRKTILYGKLNGKYRGVVTSGFAATLDASLYDIEVVSGEVAVEYPQNVVRKDELDRKVFSGESGIRGIGVDKPVRVQLLQDGQQISIATVRLHDVKIADCLLTNQVYSGREVYGDITFLLKGYIAHYDVVEAQVPIPPLTEEVDNDYSSDHELILIDKTISQNEQELDSTTSSPVPLNFGQSHDDTAVTPGRRSSSCLGVIGQLIQVFVSGFILLMVGLLLFGILRGCNAEYKSSPKDPIVEKHDGGRTLGQGHTTASGKRSSTSSPTATNPQTPTAETPLSTLESSMTSGSMSIKDERSDITFVDSSLNSNRGVIYNTNATYPFADTNKITSGIPKLIKPVFPIGETFGARETVSVEHNVSAITVDNATRSTSLLNPSDQKVDTQNQQKLKVLSYPLDSAVSRRSAIYIDSLKYEVVSTGLTNLINAQDPSYFEKAFDRLADWANADTTTLSRQAIILSVIYYFKSLEGANNLSQYQKRLFTPLYDSFNSRQCEHLIQNPDDSEMLIQSSYATLTRLGIDVNFAYSVNHDTVGIIQRATSSDVNMYNLYYVKNSDLITQSFQNLEELTAHSWTRCR